MLIRKLRLQHGWTQEHLAQLTGLSVRSIQRLERGHPCSIDTQNSLAAVFEVDRSLFQPGEHSMNNAAEVKEDERKAIEHVRGIKEFYGHVIMYAFFLLAFGFAFGFRHPLILWGSIGWGLGIVVHWLTAFEIVSLFGPNWERKRVEKRLGRTL
ncbi:MAG: 2TM domain-containing protein [Steroidobacteraceae bacterium]